MNSKKDVCVTFDLWETLILDKPELDDARSRLRCEGIHQALVESGIAIRLEDLKTAHEQSAIQLQEMWRNNNGPSSIEQVRIIMTQAGLNGVHIDSKLQRSLERAYVEPLFVVPPELNSEAEETLRHMKERVRRIGLVSNTGRAPGLALRELLKKYGILEFFDSITFSDEAGSRKPDRVIFEKALMALSTVPSKVVHFGDDPEADVWGAKRAGMKAVLFDYPVPEGFRKRPNSLFALSRFDRRIPDSEIKADGRITSLKESLEFIDSLN